MDGLANWVSDRQEETGVGLYVGGVMVVLGGEYSPRVPSPLLSSPNYPPAVPGVRNTFYFIFTFQSQQRVYYKALY